MKCAYCKKPTKKQYIIADDMEDPRPMCDKCHQEFFYKCIQELGKLDDLEHKLIARELIEKEGE